MIQRQKSVEPLKASQRRSVLKTSADSFQPGSGNFDGEDDLRGGGVRGDVRSGEDEDSLEGAPRPATSQPGHRQSLGDASSCGQVHCSLFWFWYINATTDTVSLTVAFTICYASLFCIRFYDEFVRLMRRLSKKGGDTIISLIVFSYKSWKKYSEAQRKTKCQEARLSVTPIFIRGLFWVN